MSTYYRSDIVRDGVLNDKYRPSSLWHLYCTWVIVLYLAVSIVRLASSYLYFGSEIYVWHIVGVLYIFVVQINEIDSWNKLMQKLTSANNEADLQYPRFPSQRSKSHLFSVWLQGTREQKKTMWLCFTVPRVYVLLHLDIKFIKICGEVEAGVWIGHLSCYNLPGLPCSRLLHVSPLVSASTSFQRSFLVSCSLSALDSYSWIGKCWSI